MSDKQWKLIRKRLNWDNTLDFIMEDNDGNNLELINVYPIAVEGLGGDGLPIIDVRFKYEMS